MSWSMEGRLPASLNISIMRAVNTFVMEPILKAVSPPGAPRLGSAEGIDKQGLCQVKQLCQTLTKCSYTLGT